MQTCSRCNATARDTDILCPNCQALLAEYSQSRVTLKRLQENPRVRAILVNTPADACPVCFEKRGTYNKDEAPALPCPGCSEAMGCRCTYVPILSDIYP